MSYEEEKKLLLKDASTSDWLKEAIVKLNNCDVLDVLNELECLTELFLLRFEEVKVAWEADKRAAL